jgi:hypothetical protein
MYHRKIVSPNCVIEKILSTETLNIKESSLKGKELSKELPTKTEGSPEESSIKSNGLLEDPSVKTGESPEESSLTIGELSEESSIKIEELPAERPNKGKESSTLMKKICYIRKEALLKCYNNAVVSLKTQIEAYPWKTNFTIYDKSESEEVTKYLVHKFPKDGISAKPTFCGNKWIVEITIPLIYSDI